MYSHTLSQEAILQGMGKILLDFDGTPAFRPGMWSQCLIDVLDEISPGHEIGMDDIRPHLRDGFPWHEPARSRLELSDRDQWWENLSPLFIGAFEAVDVPLGVRDAAVTRVRTHYCDPGRYRLFPDRIDAIETLRRNGWELVILSNHVPELQSIVDGVGLGPLIDEVFSSAITGYEKPNPESYRVALGGNPPGECFMVGDNVEADVLGAERVGLPAILVRNPSAHPQRAAPDLQSAVALILAPFRRSTTPLGPDLARAQRHAMPCSPSTRQSCLRGLSLHGLRIGLRLRQSLDRTRGLSCHPG